MDLALFGSIALFLGLSARWNWWRLPKKGIPILLYHKIGKAPKNSKLKKLWVSKEKFYKQMNFLKSNGYTPITFKDLPLFSDKKVIITFDDGYENIYENAFPILKEFNFKFVIFMVINAIGKNNFWHNPQIEQPLPMLNIKQMKEMKYLCEFGSHCLTHPALSKLTKNEIEKEIKQSKVELEKILEDKVITFAYPYGDGENLSEVRQIVKESGYKFGCGCHWGIENFKNDFYSLKRVWILGDEYLFDFYLNLTRGRCRL